MQNPKVVELHRLTPEVYANLAKQFPPFAPTATATSLQAGYALGVEAVLAKLRNGWVIER